MKIPEPEEIVQIEYKAERFRAIVNSVFPHATKRGIHLLWLLVKPAIAVGESVRLITDEGRFAPVRVLRIENREQGRLIQIEAFEGERPNP